MSSYSFTRTHARSLVWFGWIVFALCLIAGAILALAGGTIGLAAFFAGKGLSAAAASMLSGLVILTAGAVVGVVIATPFIVAGELILVQLDHRAIAAKHLRVAKRIRRLLRPRAPDDSRPVRRRVI